MRRRMETRRCVTTVLICSLTAFRCWSKVFGGNWRNRGGEQIRGGLEGWNGEGGARYHGGIGSESNSIREGKKKARKEMMQRRELPREEGQAPD